MTAKESPAGFCLLIQVFKFCPNQRPVFINRPVKNATTLEPGQVEVKRSSGAFVPKVNLHIGCQSFQVPQVPFSLVESLNQEATVLPVGVGRIQGAVAILFGVCGQHMLLLTPPSSLGFKHGFQRELSICESIQLSLKLSGLSFNLFQPFFQVSRNILHSHSLSGACLTKFRPRQMDCQLTMVH